GRQGGGARRRRNCRPGVRGGRGKGPQPVRGSARPPIPVRLAARAQRGAAASRLRWWGDDRQTARASPISLRGGAVNDDGLAADRKPDLYAGGAGKDVPSGSGVVSIESSSPGGVTPLCRAAARIPAAERVPIQRTEETADERRSPVSS